MPDDTTERDEQYAAREWFDNANFHDVPRVINRIARECWGFHEHTLLTAILRCWDSCDVDSKVYWIRQVACASSKSLDDGILFSDPPPAPPTGKGDTNG